MAYSSGSGSGAGGGGGGTGAGGLGAGRLKAPMISVAVSFLKPVAHSPRRLGPFDDHGAALHHNPK